MKKFIGLITRCKNEPYVKEFVKYYLKQGIDKIHIIDDNSDDKKIYKGVKNNQKLEIIYDKNIIENKSINKLYNKIKNNFEWIIYVDIDEYIVTKKNIKNTIRKELKTTFKNCDCVKVPWVMMSCNSIKKNPDSLLETNVYRWNHDNKHKNNITNEHKFRCRYDSIEVKCIFKPSHFNNITDHHPIEPVISNTRVVDSISKKQQELNSLHSNLREKDITEGYLLCYHYRIISVENSLNKIITNNWYKKYTLKDIMSSDYPEIIDETLKNKIK